ncbi:MAG: glutamine--fructose-6-phosphate transaminase (isomerizing) [Negativicutes bacterium]|nr:glutamine--fructose-6-phosphate transaminase (isomerizing) [Negativicutes bacterium]
MCGIMGYVGPKDALPIILDGLRCLEYRGYDSAGVAIIDAGKLNQLKSAGRLSELEAILKEKPLTGHIGIGHTRWATHGEPNNENAHPHLGSRGRITLIHNGVIENYKELRQELITKGIALLSQTDSEVVVNLLEETELPLMQALDVVLPRLRGAYALVMLDLWQPDRIVVARKDNPVVIGLGKGENYVASDIPALLPYTREMIFLNDGERAVITKEKVIFYQQDGGEIEKQPQEITWTAEAADKVGFEHYMLKEIHEQPKVLRETMRERMPNADGRKFFAEMDAFPWDWQQVNHIHIVACGTAYYAGMAGKYMIERVARIPVEVDMASEFRYREPILKTSDVVIIISQSGETADTLGALREAQRRGAKVLAVTNVMGSTVSREADFVVYTQAGPEIAVASTKAYISQLLIMLMLAFKLGNLRGQVTDTELALWMEKLRVLPYWVEKVLLQEKIIADWARQIAGYQNFFFIGRDLDYALALEGALKLKEISYIHAEAYAAGELKHGPLALISGGTPVVALTTQSRLVEKALSNIEVVKARGALVYHITNAEIISRSEDNEHILALPELDDLLMPILAIVPLQLLAYHAAVTKGNNVDKPRNLAKSVTVE